MMVYVAVPDTEELKAEGSLGSKSSRLVRRVGAKFHKCPAKQKSGTKNQ